MFKQIWDKLWAWTRNSGTVLLARLEVITGFIIAVLSSIDWSVLLALDFSSAFALNNFTILGGIMIVKGILAEWTRLRGTKEVDGHLIPTAATLKKVK